MFKECSDIVIRPFDIEENVHALAVFVDGLVLTTEVDEALKAVMIYERGSEDAKRLLETVIPSGQAKTTDNYGDFLLGVLSGDTGIIIENSDKAILLGLRGPSLRSVSEPPSEAVIRGPREGFIENLRTNTSLVRRKIKSPRLKMKPFVIGKHSNTSVVLSYMEGITDPALVEEAVKRLQKIEIDGILDSGYIEELIQDSAFSPFPQIQHTERPDLVAAALLEGRIAIFVDGTPFVLLAPTVFVQLLQATEDYYERFQIGTLVRWLRYFFLFASLVTPAMYVALTTYHHVLIPTKLLFSIAAARESIPFPAIVETLIMEVIFEALREAGVRLPKAIGSAVGILGALVIGQAAVEAGIVSAPVVIVVSITGIASFTIPHFNGAIAVRMLRFPLLILASIFGVYGIFFGLILIIGHMANLRSFGVPYLTPISPLKLSDLKDVLIRAPQWALSTRPSFLHVRDDTRMSDTMSKEIKDQNGSKGDSPDDKR
ncbi:spore germination protein [Cohnella soli]|uniref:Spore germination protein n=1 Tax=Cohnella soli TaxID=425005 RepID=A0ABW0HTY7_9BACL